MLFTMKWWLFAATMYYIYGEKISMHLSRYEKNMAFYYNRFVKIFQNYASSCIFFGIMCIMHSEPNYAISHLHIILEALLLHGSLFAY